MTVVDGTRVDRKRRIARSSFESGAVAVCIDVDYPHVGRDSSVQILNAFDLPTPLGFAIRDRLLPWLRETRSAPMDRADVVGTPRPGRVRSARPEPGLAIC